jgi:Flp pilus assembly protein TadG
MAMGMPVLSPAAICRSMGPGEVPGEASVRKRPALGPGRLKPGEMLLTFEGKRTLAGEEAEVDHSGGCVKVRSIIRCRDGAALVEFAMVAPLFLALLFAIFQIAYVFIAQAMLETTAEAAARVILTGQVQTYSGTSGTTTYTGMTQSDYASAVCTMLKARSPFMSCANLYIDVTTVDSYADATTGLPTLTYDSSGAVSNSWNYTIGTQGSIVVLRVMYVLPVVGTPLGFTLGNLSTTKRLLLATSVFRVEGYSS